MSNFLLIEKEVYEAVLRNSLKVNALEKENAQLKEDCKDFEMIRREARAEVKRLKNQLKIALKALEEYANNEHWSDTSEELYLFAGCFCSDGYKLAENALDQIKQIGEK